MNRTMEVERTSYKNSVSLGYKVTRKPCFTHSTLVYHIHYIVNLHSPGSCVPGGKGGLMGNKTIKNQGIDILEYIPFGHDNAITRKCLSIVLGIDDRIVRDLIHDAREKHTILNLQDGKGYFRPDPDKPSDIAFVKRYVMQEESRIRNTGMSLKAARKFLKGV